MKLKNYKEKFIKLYKAMQKEHGHFNGVSINTSVVEDENGKKKEVVTFDAFYNEQK